MPERRGSSCGGHAQRVQRVRAFEGERGAKCFLVIHAVLVATGENRSSAIGGYHWRGCGVCWACDLSVLPGARVQFGLICNGIKGDTIY